MKRTAVVAQLAALAPSVVPDGLNRDAPPAGVDPMERRQPQAGGRGERTANFVPGSYNAATHSVDAVLSAGTAVRRYYFTEELEISTSAIDLGRVERGLCPLLDAHNQYSASGVGGNVSNVRIENGELVGTFTFGETELGQLLEGMVARGELRGVSIGYRVTTWVITRTEDDGHETWRATAWELLEASLVPVPADPNAGIRSAPGNALPGSSQEEEDMRRNLPGGAAAAAPAPVIAPVVVPPVEAERAAPMPPAAPVATVTRFTAGTALAFVDQARAFGDAMATRANELVAQNEAGQVSIEAARAQIMTEAAEAQRAAVGQRGGPSPATIPDAQFAARATAMQGALLHMANPARYQLDEAARAFAGRSLRTLARTHLEACGVRTDMMGDVEVAQQVLRRSAGMQSTSDFPAILGNTVGRTMRDAYSLAPRTYQAFSRRTTASDFRLMTRIALSDAPALEQVNEGEEYTFGTMGDEAVSYKVLKYGKRMAITWETIINDDLNAFSRIPTAIGSRAALLENEIIYGFLINNPTMTDGYALFSSQHGNLASPGADIDLTTLGAGRIAMRTQKAPQGGKMNIVPTQLIAGPLMEEKANQYTSANFVAATSATINPEYNRSLSVTIDSQIEDNRWFLSGDPAANDTIEHSYLLGQEGLMIDQKLGWEVDGVEIKARLVFGGSPIDYRALYESPAH